MRREKTPAEALLWQHLRASRLNSLHFRRQQIIDGFIADFYCHAAHLIIEVDGRIHDKRADYDTERDRTLAARGLRILRFPNERILNDLHACLDDIRAASESIP